MTLAQAVLPLVAGRDDHDHDVHHAAELLEVPAELRAGIHLHSLHRSEHRDPAIVEHVRGVLRARVLGDVPAMLSAEPAQDVGHGPLAAVAQPDVERVHEALLVEALRFLRRHLRGGAWSAETRADHAHEVLGARHDLRGRAVQEKHPGEALVGRVAQHAVELRQRVAGALGQTKPGASERDVPVPRGVGADVTTPLILLRLQAAELLAHRLLEGLRPRDVGIGATCVAAGPRLGRGRREGPRDLGGDLVAQPDVVG